MQCLMRSYRTWLHTVVKLFNAIRQAQQPSSTNKQESREDRPGPKAPVAVDKFFDLLGAGNGDLAGHEEHHDAPDDVSLSDGSDD